MILFASISASSLFATISYRHFENELDAAPDRRAAAPPLSSELISPTDEKKEVCHESIDRLSRFSMRQCVVAGVRDADARARFLKSECACF